MKMQIKTYPRLIGSYGRRRRVQTPWRWTVKWMQDGKPRTYFAASWGEAVGFACAQLRLMKDLKELMQ